MRPPGFVLRKYTQIGLQAAADVQAYARFGWRLREFFRHPLTLAEARNIVERRLAEREANFLNLVERGIFRYARSPYLPLMRLAGCELGDIRQLVRQRELEGTLRALRAAGVYVDYEEFKGRRPIVRNGREIPVQAVDFDNPIPRKDYEVRSGGTTGAGTPVPISLDRLATEAPPTMLSLHAHGVLGIPQVFWRGILPDSSGINNVLRSGTFRQFPQVWFTPVTHGELKQPARTRYATEYFVLAARLSGAPIPWPQPLSLAEAGTAARAAAAQVARAGACLIRAPMSLALRISLRAIEEGIDLTGAVFLAGGEPPTPAKEAALLRSGARFFPNYSFTEGGAVGMGCARPADENDIHLFMDLFALIQHPRLVPGTDVTVEAFNITTLLPVASKIMLNVEVDDYGVSENRTCGCPLEACGYTQHLRHIRSFAKLTGEGEAVLGGEMLRILEEVLPGRFGGTLQDYQLLEEEDAAGFTRLTLIVSPRVHLADESQIIDTVLGGLGDKGARATWRNAQTLKVKRMEPIWTERGKFLPLIPLGLAQRLRRIPQLSI